MKNIIEITSEVKQAKDLIRLAPYCRVSSDSLDQLHSFAAQIRYYTEYAQRNPGYTLVDIYADEGITGTSMKKRDEFNRLMDDCKKGKIDRIIVKSISRFARNTEELLAALRILSELGISVYFEENGIDTAKLNSEMIVTFPGMAAQQESVAISENVRWSYKKRMESGEFNCCAPAYGFNLVNGQLEINEAEAVTVRRIFDLYLQGFGKQSIAKILNADHISRRYGQKKWYTSTIDYILNNERYMGDALLQKKYTTDTMPFTKKRNHGERAQYYVENSNSAIVSREIYQAAQELQAKRKPTAGKTNRTHILTGMLRCPECGRAFRRQESAGTVYWLCSGKSSGVTECRSSRRIKEDEVYSSFMLMMAKLTDNREWLLGSLIKQFEEMQYKTNGNSDRIKAIDKEIADLGAQNLVIARLHTKGILDSAEYAAQSSEIGNKINKLRLERRKVISEDTDESILEELKSLNSILEETKIGYEFQQELFEQIIESITVDDNETLTFKLPGGIELTEKIQEKRRCKSA